MSGRELFGSLTLPAGLEALTPLRELVSQAASKAGLSSDKIADIDVALEEVVVNIINHAYDNGDGSIEVCCGVEQGKCFFVECIDQGPSFDAETPTKAQAQQNMKDLQVGGLGLFLVGQLVDNVQYDRRDEKNVLTLLIDL